MVRLSAIFGVYLLLSVLVTWPLVRDMRTLIAGGTTDPVLNAAVLQWNATTTPFSRAWWNPPHYYPTTGVAAFTESLVGVSPIASPAYWLTRNPIFAYNLSVFLTWPLSAFAAYLLVRFLTHREDAAFLSGLSFGFSPYRVVGFPHIQTLATFGIALCLLGMHGYVERRRWPWLMLFGLGGCSSPLRTLITRCTARCSSGSGCCISACAAAAGSLVSCSWAPQRLSVSRCCPC